MRKKNTIENIKCLVSTGVWVFPVMAFSENEDNVKLLREAESRGGDA